MLRYVLLISILAAAPLKGLAAAEASGGNDNVASSNSTQTKTEGPVWVVDSNRTDSRSGPVWVVLVEQAKRGLKG